MDYLEGSTCTPSIGDVARLLLQGLWCQGGGDKCWVGDIVDEGDGHDMKDRTHCRACMFLVFSILFAFTLI